MDPQIKTSLLNEKEGLLSDIDKIEFQLKNRRKKISELKKQLTDEETVIVGLKLDLDRFKDLLRKYKMNHDDSEG